MNAEILAVGTELLMGQIANTNAQYITARLQEKGVNVYYHTVVGDNSARLSETLRQCLKRSDVVIMTGGLGPTEDDLSKETVAEVFGKKLILHDQTVEAIKAFFAKAGREMTPNNLKQAYMPENSTVLENPNGTAPGYIVEGSIAGESGKAVILLPGPPREMYPMFDRYVIPWLSEKSGKIIRSKFLRIFGIGESALEYSIKDMIHEQENPTIAPYAKEGQVMLRVTAFADSEHDAEMLIKPVVGEIEKRVGSCLYSVENEELHEVVFKLLKERKMKIALAESCTGGMISATLVGIPGVSEVFERGVVCYSNESKISMLNVSKATLEKHGAVSHETAEEMAKGIAEISGADIGLSVTGIAGPDGGTPEKPVGLIYIGLHANGVSSVKKVQLTGERARVRNAAMLNVFDMARRHLLGLPSSDLKTFCPGSI